MQMGTITQILQRPAGPEDYERLGYDRAYQEIENLYLQAVQGMPRKSGAKGKGDVEPSKDVKSKAAEVKAKGRGNDTELAHITPGEAKKLKKGGGSGTVNPKTGLLEFDDGGGDGGDGGGGEGAGGGGAASGGAPGGPDAGTGVGLGGGDSAPSTGESSSLGGPPADTEGTGEGRGDNAPENGTPAGTTTSGPTATGNVGDDTEGTGEGRGNNVAGNQTDTPAFSFSEFGGPSPLGVSVPTEGIGAPVVGEAAGRSHATFGTLANAGLLAAFESIMSSLPPFGTSLSPNTSPVSMAASVLGNVPGPLGALAGVTGLASSTLGGGSRGFGLGSGQGQSAGPGSGMGSGPGGQGPGNGPATGGTPGTSSEEDSILPDSLSPSGPTASGSSSGLDSALESITSGRPGSRTIAGTPYAPSFGGSSTINPAALSAALGAINRPRPGPGLQFGRTTYL